MHYLVTGHTGFKGSWLVLLLRSRGHEVSGLALDPVPGALFERAEVAPELANDVRADVRDREAVATTLSGCSPDVVIHMAAQPLVRESLKQPRVTFETNALGTLSVLEAVSATPVGACARRGDDRQGLPQHGPGGRVPGRRTARWELTPTARPRRWPSW